MFNKKIKYPDWFKTKRYCHIDRQIQKDDFPRINTYVSSPEKIARHSFLPFIHREVKTRKFRRNIDADGKKSRLRYSNNKTRHIHYCSHLDSAIYSYYKYLIESKYENSIVEISDSITAYRKSPKGEKGQNNIHFAKEVFDYIKNSKEDLYVFTADITSFFDNLDHDILKDKWCEVMNFSGQKSMPSDHYTIFRNITKFSYIEEEDLFKFFKEKIIVERKNIDKSIYKTHKSIKRKKYLFNQRAVAFCKLENIKQIRDANLIKSNKWVYDKEAKLKEGLRTKGIPQGSPISALLANLYMLDFDKAMFKYTKTEGLYRRYSDDIVLIVPIDQVNEARQKLQDEIKLMKLEIKEEKTQEFKFTYNSITNKYECEFLDKEVNEFSAKKNLEYLGFEFNGEHIRIKSASLAAFYRKMKRTIKRGKFYARYINNSTKGKLFLRTLYKRFTRKGGKRKVKHVRDKKNSSIFNPLKYHDWGNFHTYTNMAIDIMEGGSKKNGPIKKQLRKSWNKFHKLIK
jgi:hypothetical protein